MQPNDRRSQIAAKRTHKPMIVIIGCGLFSLFADMDHAGARSGQPSTASVPPPPPTSMVNVPEGAFLMGCNEQDDRDCERDERPAKEVFVDAFYIDAQEVTVASYAACVEAGKCTTLELERGRGCNWGEADRLAHPINCVDWDQAAAFCAWAGKRLPTEAEWEKAARGTDGRIFPWGNAEASCELAVISDSQQGCGLKSTSPVCSKPASHSPYGACDMAGNVMEWVADWHSKRYYESGPRRNPPGPTEGHARVLRGGFWDSTPTYVRVSDRTKASGGHRANYLGFRCAWRAP